VSARKFKHTVVDSFHVDGDSGSDYGIEKNGASAHLEAVNSKDVV
jgi:SP family general alpha glucoside:H+ symporter-like MFS transporter